MCIKFQPDIALGEQRQLKYEELVMNQQLLETIFSEEKSVRSRNEMVKTCN